MICFKATQIPNLKSHRVNLLPQLKGTGLVYDSLIAYNLDPEFKALAQEMSTNMPRVATEFATFLEHYSGYTAYVNELQEKYSIENFQMQEADKQAWIVERFEATDKYTTTINNYYTKNSDGSIAKSGYQALSYYDTNNDGVVDSTDTRFNELSLWIDSNQDGVTDTGELKTLSEMGVTSLTLNSTSPYIPSSENTNTIIEETTFTDANGEGIMRDILFRYENTSKPTEGVYFDMDANGIQEKMTRWTDPNQWMIVKDINNDGEITSGKEGGKNLDVLCATLSLEYTFLFFTNSFKQNTCNFITKQDNIYNYFKISNRLDFNKEEVA
ncbi:MAG: hypothetical protein AB7D43_04650 [Sulfurimonadaceae bacterium]